MKRLLTLTTLLPSVLALTACAAAELPTLSPNPSSTATLTPSAAPTLTATPMPSNTPSPTDTPTIQPIPSDCDAGVVIFSAHAVIESKKSLDGLYIACSDASFFHQILSIERLNWPETTSMRQSFTVSHDGAQVFIPVIDEVSQLPEDSIYTGSIYTLDLSSYNFEVIYTADYWMTKPTLSINDEYLMYFAGVDRVDTEIEILHLDTLTVSRITDSGRLPLEDFEYYNLHDLDWLPNGKQIFYSADTYDGSEYSYSWPLIDILCDSNTHLCEPVDNHELGWIPDLTYTLSWIQDGSGIISLHYYRVDPDEEIYIHVIAFRSLDGTILKEIELEGYSPPGYGGVRDSVLSPDGKRIAFIAAIEGDWATSLGEVLILSLEDMSITDLTEDPMFDDVMPGEVYWLP